MNLFVILRIEKICNKSYPDDIFHTGSRPRFNRDGTTFHSYETIIPHRFGEGFFVDKMADPQYNLWTMTDIDRGENYGRAVEFVNKRASGFSSPVDEARAYMGIAQLEATHTLANSQRLLAETIVEANRLKRIELRMAELGVLPGDLSSDEPFRGVAPATPDEIARSLERDAYDSPAR